MYIYRIVIIYVSLITSALDDAFCCFFYCFAKVVWL